MPVSGNLSTHIRSTLRDFQELVDVELKSYERAIQKAR